MTQISSMKILLHEFKDVICMDLQGHVGDPFQINTTWYRVKHHNSTSSLGQVLHVPKLCCGVDVSYGGLFLWWNGVFSLGIFYSNVLGD